MVDITPEIVEKLKSLNYPWDVVVVEGYPLTTPDFVKPMVTVREVSNTVDNDTYTNKEVYSNITVEVEIYSRAQELDGAVLAGNRVCANIRNLIDDCLSTVYGFTRTATPFTQPSVFDSTVSRTVLSYQVTVNVETLICYKGEF